MSHPVAIHFRETDLEALSATTGRIALFAEPGARLSAGARRLDRMMRGAIGRALASEAAAKLKPGESIELAWPAALAAEAVQIIRLPRRASVADARKAGAAVGRSLGASGALVLAEGHARAAEISLGLALRAYDFRAAQDRCCATARRGQLHGHRPRGRGQRGAADGGAGRGRVLHPRSGQ